MSEPNDNPDILLEENDREPELTEVRDDLKATEPIEPEPETVAPQEPVVEEWTPERQRAYIQALEQHNKGLQIALGRTRSKKEHLETVIQERLDALNARLNPPEPPPSMEDQPVPFLHKGIQDVQSEVRQLREAQAQQQMMAGVEAFRQTVRQDEAAFVQSHPDYYDRINQGRQVLAQHLIATGCPEEELVREVFRHEAMIAKGAMERGLSPAEEAYRLSSQVAPQNGSPAPQEAPGAPNPVPVGQPVTTPGIEAARRAKSLSSTSGAPSKGTITLADLADPETYDKIYSDPRRWREINETGRTSMPS